MTEAPKMLHVLHGHDPLDNEERDYSFGYPGPLYYSATEHARIVAREILDAQIRAFENGRLDTPDEIRAIAGGTK